MSAKFSSSARFGRVPKASVLEERENKLKQEFDDFNLFKESDELARFKELEAFISSKEFEDIKKEINAKKFAGSEPYEKEKTYKSLKKSKRIKAYYQLKDSKELKDFESFSTSEKLANYKESDQFYTSTEFEEFKKSLNNQKAEKTKEIKDEQNTFNKLKKKYKWYFTLKDSTQLSDFNNFNESSDLQNFIDLENEVKAIDFDALKRGIAQQKKDMATELSSLVARQKELKNQCKNHKGPEAFPEKDELDEITRKIESGEHKRAIKDIRIENLDEYKKLKEFGNLKKSSKIKNYFKFKNSGKYKQFIDLEGSPDIESYIEFDKKINSPEFKSRIEEAKNIKFENTEEYKKQLDYKSLKKSTEIQQYFKFKSSKNLKIYNEMNDSAELSDFEELEKYISSDEFKEEKTYLLTKDKFKLAEEYKQEVEFKELKDSEKIKWFFNLEKKNEFDKLSEWELTFEDDFDGNKLDTEKWMCGYYWGKNLLKDDYVQVSEKQFFKEANLEFSNSILSIVTKEEKVQGKVWDQSMGFYPKGFDYTSGLINTGQYFRQECGLFKAKIKVKHSFPIHHAFWLLGEKITPEIDIFKYGAKSGSKIEIANYWNGGDNIKKFKKLVGGVDFSKDYYIYSLEWTKEKLTWKINDLVVYEQNEGIPKEPMYIVLSSGINNEGNVKAPSSMDIDWVRVYKKSE